MAEYEKLVIENTTWAQMCRQNITELLFASLGMKKETSQKTYNTYLGDAKKAQKYEQDLGPTKIECRKCPEYTKEQIIEAVKLQKELELKNRSLVFDLTRQEKDNPQFNIPGKMKIEDCKKADKIFEETGIEDFDIEPSIDRMNLRNDPAMTEIMQDVAIKTMQLQAQKIRDNVDGHKIPDENDPIVKAKIEARVQAGKERRAKQNQKAKAKNED